MFCVFNFNSKYYFVPSPEAGGRHSDEVDLVVTEQAQGVQEKGATVPDGEGPELEVVPGSISLQIPGASGLDIRVGTQTGVAGLTLGDRSTRRRVERSKDEDDTANPDQESTLSKAVAEGTMESVYKKVNGVEIYKFLQQLFKDNPDLAKLLGVVIRGRNGVPSYPQLRPFVEEALRVLVINQQVLVGLSEKVLNDLLLKQVLSSLKERVLNSLVDAELDSAVAEKLDFVLAEELDAVKPAVAGHKEGVEGLTTAIEILKKELGTETKGYVRHPVGVAILLLVLMISINSSFWTSVAYAQESAPEIPQPPQPTAGGGGQGTSTPEATPTERVPDTPAPVTPTTGGGEQGTPTPEATPTPQPSPTPEATPYRTPTIEVTAVTVGPTAVTVTAIVTATPTERVPDTPAPVTPTTGGGEQGTPTPRARATETPPPATITMIIPSPTATPPGETPTTPPATATPPTETPPTETPTPPPTDVPPPRPPTETPEQPPTATPEQPPTATNTPAATQTPVVTIIPPPPRPPIETPEQPPTATPEQPPTETPIPTPTVIIQTPTGETIEFKIPPTATAALFRQPRVEHADTSGAVPDSERGWSSQMADLLELVPLALLVAASILGVAAGFANYRSKKQ